MAAIMFTVGDKHMRAMCSFTIGQKKKAPNGRVEVLRPSQPNGVMSSAVSLPNHTFTGQA